MNDAQIVDLLNYLYRPTDEYYANSLYTLKKVSMKEIFGVVWKYTNKFDEKSLLSFTTWCNKHKLDFLSVEPECKALKGQNQKIRFRHLNVLDEKYHDNVASNIENILPQHKAQIRSLKEDGLSIVGYCRKSDLAKQDNLISLLQRMVDNHYQRSLVDKVFVSPCSNASSPFSERDLSDQFEVFNQLKNVHGNTKDMLNYVENNDNICLISLDFAGLSTNMADLKEFVRNNKSIKKNNH